VKLRLLSYNIRSLRDDNEALFRVIRSAQADVVCLQEMPRFLRWRSTMAGIARRTGMVVVTGGRPAGGNAIMSTLGVTVHATQDVVLSRDRGQYLRGTAIAVLSRDGVRFTVAGTHLDLVEGPRLRHVGELHHKIDELVPDGGPRIVAGDMNCKPGEPAWLALTERATDVWAAVGDGDGYTFSADNPRRRIDGVFAGPGVRPVSATILHSPDTEVATDHCPLLVELEI
jgi:endonuclease/exonuclease/phosphatase family metal-dependent hydrolase